MSVLPPPWHVGSAEPPEDPVSHADWQIPAPLVACVQAVLDVVRRHHRSIRVVDVNRPGEYAEQVHEYVVTPHTFPVLVAPDGRRLEGIESFGESTLERFMAPRR
jgi:hypothetical protein